jgi:hypothetical protein
MEVVVLGLEEITDACLVLARFVMCCTMEINDLVT